MSIVACWYSRRQGMWEYAMLGSRMISAENYISRYFIGYMQTSTEKCLFVFLMWVVILTMSVVIVVQVFLLPIFLGTHWTMWYVWISVLYVREGLQWKWLVHNWLPEIRAVILENYSHRPCYSTLPAAKLSFEKRVNKVWPSGSDCAVMTIRRLGYWYVRNVKRNRGL